MSSQLVACTIFQWALLAPGLGMNSGSLFPKLFPKLSFMRILRILSSNQSTGYVLTTQLP